MALFLILNNINISLTRKFLMSSSKNGFSSLIFRKIHFSVGKKVRYGQGVFVCGNVPELGNWDPSKAYRLKWREVLKT